MGGTKSRARLRPRQVSQWLAALLRSSTSARSGEPSRSHSDSSTDSVATCSISSSSWGCAFLPQHYLRFSSTQRRTREQTFPEDRLWPLCKSCHNGHYEKVAVMKSCPPVGAPAVVRVANRLAGSIHNFVATLGGKLGADGAGGVLGRLGGGSACLVRPARPRLFTFAVTTAAAQVTTPRSAGIMRSRSAQTNLPS